jgi:hypothetical protein
MPFVEEVDFLECMEIVLPHLQNLISRSENAIVNYEDLKLEESDIYLIDSLIGDFTNEDLATVEETGLC